MLHCLVCEWDVHGKRACDERKVFIECCELWSGRVLEILVRPAGSCRSRRRRKNSRCQTRDGKNVRTIECVFGWDVNVE